MTSHYEYTTCFKSHKQISIFPTSFKKFHIIFNSIPHQPDEQQDLLLQT